jgi:hypothetical protein
VYPLDPQSEFESHSISWSIQLPLEHVWFVPQSSKSLFWFEEEQYEEDVPALLQVYVVYFLYTSPFEQKAEPVYPDVPH